jgi:hypothetical protein
MEEEFTSFNCNAFSLTSLLSVSANAVDLLFSSRLRELARLVVKKTSVRVMPQRANWEVTSASVMEEGMLEIW